MNPAVVVQKIVERVVEECRKFNVEVDEGFCKFFVKLIKRDPNWRLKDASSYRRIDILNFVAYAAKRFQNPDEPKMKILQLQFCFETLTENYQKFVEDRRDILTKKLEPLKLLILKYNPDKDDLYKKGLALINYITLASGLGNPQNVKVCNEVRVALSSVLSGVEFHRFLESDREEKIAKLNELCSVVAGIRLYNMECSKGGEGIQYLPLLLTKSIASVRKILSSCMKTRKIDLKIQILSRALDRCYLENNTKTKCVLDRCITPSISEDDVDYGKMLLALYNQFSICISKMLRELDMINKTVQATKNSYDRILTEMRSLVVSKCLMRASDVFPSFIQLYDYWRGFQDEIVLLALLKASFQEQLGITESLPFYSKLLKNIKTEDININSSNLMSDLNRIEYLENLELIARLPKQGAQIYIHRKEIFVDYKQLKLEYSGFCCWKLVASEGILFPGNEDYGIVEFKSKYYVFSSSRGLDSFVKDPEFYIIRVLNLARKNYELIVLLCLRDELDQYKTIEKIVDDEVKEARINYVETVDSTLDGYKDLEYESNIWNLKRKALQLADLKCRKTTSTQTVKTCFLMTVGLQKNLCKEQAIQTNSNAASNTPKRSRFIVGLRRRRDSRPHGLDITQYERKFDNK